MKNKINIYVLRREGTRDKEKEMEEKQQNLN